VTKLSDLLAGISAILLVTVASADTRLNDGTVLSDTPTWIVTYIEVAADSVDEAKNLIVEQTTSSRLEEGNLRFEALQRLGRGNHFVILEAWTDPDARAAHAGSPHTMSFRRALQPILYAPYDERPHVGLAATAPESIPEGNDSTIYVLTHADIIPPEQFAPCSRAPNVDGPCGNELLTNLASSSREHAGNLRFDILTQSNRGNHMTVVEMWDSADSQAAHQSHADKKRFRDELAGVEAASGVNSDPQFILNMMTGSLWDERLYRLITN
jgi:quinol monooxygenase YgiN